MIIPGGGDHIESGDLIFVTTTREWIEEVRIKTGKQNPEVKNIIIMGGGRIAIRASQYMPDNIHIKIIETDREKCVQISEKVPKNVLIIHGDGRPAFSMALTINSRASRLKSRLGALKACSLKISILKILI